LVFFVLPFTATYAYLFVGVALLIAMIFPYLLIGLTAITFPYRFKSAYESSGIKGSIAGLPKIVWAGIGTVFFMAISIYLLLTNSIYGANSTPALQLLVGAIVVSTVLYYLARAVRAKQGLDMNLVYAQIPPE